MFGVEHGPVFERSTVLASSQPECQGKLLIQITDKVFFLSFLNNNITITCMELKETKAFYIGKRLP